MHPPTLDSTPPVSRGRVSPLVAFVSAGVTVCVLSSFFTELATPLLFAVILIAVLFMRELDDLLLILFPIALINPQLRIGAAGMVVSEERSFHPINVNMTELMIGGILLAWMIRGRNRQGERAGAFVLIPLLLLLAASGIGIAVAVSKNSGTKIAFEKVIEPVLLVLVMTRIRWTRPRLQTALSVLLAAGVAVAVKSLYDWFFLPEATRIMENDRGVVEAVRLRSSWAATNVMAGFFGMLAPLAFLRTFYSDRGRARFWNAVAFGFLALGLAITQTRTVYAAAVLALLGISLKYRRGLVLLLITGVAVAIYGTTEMFERASSLLHATHDYSFRSRLEVWGDSLDMLVRAPLTGIGFGSFIEVYRDPLGNVHPHNDYLLLALEMGLLGLGAFLAFFVKVLTTMRRARRLAVSTQDRITLDAILAALAVFFLQSNFESLLSWPAFSFSLWYLLGIAAMYSKSILLDREEEMKRVAERMRAARPAAPSTALP